MTGKPTLKAVIAHAEKLRALAERQEKADPYLAGKVWYPTTAGSREQYRRELIGVRLDFENRPDEETPPDEELEAEAARRAIAWMDSKVVLEQVERREHERDAERSRKRHQRRAAEGLRDRDAHRTGRSLGQRIDDALAELSVIASADVAALDADRVSGSGQDLSPRYVGDPAGLARHRAIECVRFVENQLEEARRRRVESERSG